MRRSRDPVIREQRFMEAKPMLHVRQLSDPALTGEMMLRLILRFAQATYDSLIYPFTSLWKTHYSWDRHACYSVFNFSLRSSEALIYWRADSRLCRSQRLQVSICLGFVQIYICPVDLKMFSFFVQLQCLDAFVYPRRFQASCLRRLA